MRFHSLSLQCLYLHLKSLKKGLESDIGALESTRLGQLLQDGIPAASLKTHLDFFFQAFDHKEAVNGEAIVVYSGFDANFDEANDNIKAIESVNKDALFIHAPPQVLHIHTLSSSTAPHVFFSI